MYVSFFKDVVTIILMGDDAEVIIDRWPTTYTLYNEVVRYFHDAGVADIHYKNNNGRRIDHKVCIAPRGHGYYGPSLIKAQELLEKYDNCSSALQVVFLSGTSFYVVISSLTIRALVNTCSSSCHITHKI